MRVRRAFSLVELCVTLAVGGLVLLVVVSLGVREQRAHESIAQMLTAIVPLREGAAVLPVDVRATTPLAGDIVEASDTILDVHAIVGGGVICSATLGTSGATATIAFVPSGARNGELSSGASVPQAGDSVRVLSLARGPEHWAAAEVRSATLVSNGCATPSAFPLDLEDRMQRALVLTLVDSLPAGSVWPGAPARVTRRLRYSLYRASDGGWYLGLREWNGGTSRFDVVQPLLGPFASPLSGGARFSLMDTLGAHVSGERPRAIGAFAFTLVASVPRNRRAPSSAVNLARRDSTTIVVTPRNGRE